MNVYELKTSKLKYGDIFKDYISNRFVKPSDIDPILHRSIDLKIFSLLPAEFKVIELSPLMPAGASSVLTSVHQNNIIPTIRNVEVAADPTNILALECAKRRKEFLDAKSKSDILVKLCASQTLTRAQSFENRNFSAYFNVIALCTAGKTIGKDIFEEFNLTEHIAFYLKVFEDLVYHDQIKRIYIKLFSYDETNIPLIESINNKFRNNKIVELKIEENSEFGKNYYKRLRFMINIVNLKNEELNFVDGGFTDWTSKLLNNKKERLLTSGIGIDFLIRTMKLKPLFVKDNIDQ